jgi:SAM-dependent methyltransferase
VGTDAEWQAWGEAHPYYGVITDAQYRGKVLPAEIKEQFLTTGREYVKEVLDSCRHYFGDVSTQSSLDFGCGVGRLLIPLAEVSSHAVGVDIAQSMLDETAANAVARGIGNVTLARTLEQIPADRGKFTFINSYIVLQHIPTDLGLAIIMELLARLEVNGCAVLHVTYARGRYVSSMGKRPLIVKIARSIGLPLQRIRRHLTGRGDPQMLMHDYDLNKVLFLAQKVGVRCGGFEFTDHKKAFGVMLFFKREPEVEVGASAAMKVWGN